MENRLPQFTAVYAYMSEMCLNPLQINFLSAEKHGQPLAN